LFSFVQLCSPFFAVLVDNDELSLFFEGETLLLSSPWTMRLKTMKEKKVDLTAMVN
jgi:hypothetical protein